MEYAREREHEDDAQVEIKGWKDSEGATQIKALESDRTSRVQLLEQQAGDEKAADDEEDRNTGVCEEQIRAQRNFDPAGEVLGGMGNDHQQNRDGAHPVKGWDVPGFVVDLHAGIRSDSLSAHQPRA